MSRHQKPRAERFRQCGRCQRVKALTEFTGRAHWCKECWAKPGGVRLMPKGRRS